MYLCTNVDIVSITNAQIWKVISFSRYAIFILHSKKEQKVYTQQEQLRDIVM